MQNNNSLADSSGEGVVLKLGDKEFPLAPLTLQIMVTFERWCASRIVQRAKDLLPEFPPDVQIAIMADALARADSCGLGSPTGQAMFGSMEGKLYILWLSAKEKNQKVSLAEIQKAAKPTDQLYLLQTIDTIGGSPPRSVPKVSSENQTETKTENPETPE